MVQSVPIASIQVPAEGRHVGSSRVPKLGWRIAEIAAAYGIGKSTIHRDIANGLLKSRKHGSVRIVLTQDLLAYMGASDPTALILTELPSGQQS